MSKTAGNHSKLYAELRFHRKETCHRHLALILRFVQGMRCMFQPKTACYRFVFRLSRQTTVTATARFENGQPARLRHLHPILCHSPHSNRCMFASYSSLPLPSSTKFSHSISKSLGVGTRRFGSEFKSVNEADSICEFGMNSAPHAASFRVFAQQTPQTQGLEVTVFPVSVVLALIAIASHKPSQWLKKSGRLSLAFILKRLSHGGGTDGQHQRDASAQDIFREREGRNLWLQDDRTAAFQRGVRTVEGGFHQKGQPWSDQLCKRECRCVSEGRAGAAVRFCAVDGFLFIC